MSSHRLLGVEDLVAEAKNTFLSIDEERTKRLSETNVSDATYKELCDDCDAASQRLVLLIGQLRTYYHKHPTRARLWGAKGADEGVQLFCGRQGVPSYLINRDLQGSSTPAGLKQKGDASLSPLSKSKVSPSSPATESDSSPLPPADPEDLESAGRAQRGGTLEEQLKAEEAARRRVQDEASAFEQRRRDQEAQAAEQERIRRTQQEQQEAADREQEKAAKFAFSSRSSQSHQQTGGAGATGGAYSSMNSPDPQAGGSGGGGGGGRGGGYGSGDPPSQDEVFAEFVKNMSRFMGDKDKKRNAKVKLRVLEEVDSDSFRAWRIQAENAVVANGWSNLEARTQLVANLGQKAFIRMDGIKTGAFPQNNNAPADSPLADARPYQELLDEMEQRVITVDSVKQSRYKLKVAMIRKKESILDWASRLRTLYCAANPDIKRKANTPKYDHTGTMVGYEAYLDQEENLISAFIDGLPSGDMSKQVGRMKPTTLNEAITYAQDEQAAELIHLNRLRTMGDAPKSLQELSTQRGRGRGRGFRGGARGRGARGGRGGRSRAPVRIAGNCYEMAAKRRRPVGKRVAPGLAQAGGVQQRDTAAQQPAVTGHKRGCDPPSSLPARLTRRANFVNNRLEQLDTKKDRGTVTNSEKKELFKELLEVGLSAMQEVGTGQFRKLGAQGDLPGPLQGVYKRLPPPVRTGVSKIEQATAKEEENTSNHCFYNKLAVHLNGLQLEATLDTGNNYRTAISEEVALKLGYKRKHLCAVDKVRLHTAAKQGQIEVLGEVPHPLLMQHGEYQVLIQPVVLRNLRSDVNLGGPMMKILGWTIDNQRGAVMTKKGLILRLTAGKAIAGTAEEASSMAELSLAARQKQEVCRPGSVVMHKDFVFPANTLKRVRMRLKTVDASFKNRPCYFDGSDYGLPQGGCVVQPDDHGSFTVFVPNMTDDDVKVAKDSLVGEIFPLTTEATVKEMQEMKTKPSWRQPLRFAGSESWTDKCEEPEPEPEPEPPPCDTKNKTMSEKRAWVQKQFKLASNPLLSDPEKLNKATDLLAKHFSSFSHDGSYGKTHLVTHPIKLIEGARPVKQRYRPVPPQLEEEQDKQVDKWLKEGIIEKTQSPWGFNLVSVRKKHSDKLRWCVDYRRLNELTEKDSFPMPSTRECINRLAGSAMYSAVDLAGAFHCIEIDPEDRHKTAFCTSKGSWSFKRLGFGLCNGPATYCKLVVAIMSGVPDKIAVAFMDDTVVLGKDFETHLHNLDVMLKAFTKAGLKINPDKCQFFLTEIDFLGFKVTPEGSAPTESYKEAVKRIQLPTTKREVRAFVGLCAYYRDHIPDFAALAKPWTDVTGKKAGPEGKAAEKLPVVVTEPMKKSFEMLKKKLCSGHVMGHLYTSGPKAGEIILDTDFRCGQIAGVLSQMQDGKEVVIRYGSAKLSKSQAAYHSYKGELFAGMTWMVRFANPLKYLKSFKWRTDSISLIHWKTQKELSAVVTRWMETLSQFNFEVEHRPGVKHGNVDGLSRLEGAEELCPHRDPEIYKLIEQLSSQNRSSSWGTWMCGYTKSELLGMQEEDEVLGTIIKWKRQKHEPTKYEIRALPKEGQLLMKFYSAIFFGKDQLLRIRIPEGLTGARSSTPFCAPTALQELAVTAAHEQSGHAGLYKCLGMLRRTTFFVNMRSACQEYAELCLECQKKSQRHTSQRHTMVANTTGYPFQFASADHVGPLTPGSVTGQSYLFTFRDEFSKWTEAIVVPNTGADATVRALQEIMARFGVPEELKTDAHATFKSTKFKSFASAHGMKVVTTTPRHPQANGGIERVHRDLKMKLRALSEQMGLDWEEVLPYALQAIRTCPHEATGLTPAEIIFGWNPSLPLDRLFGDPNQEEREKTKGSEYRNQLRQQIRVLAEYAAKNMKSAILRRRRQYIEEEKLMEDGSLVWLFNPSIGSKSKSLRVMWTGPYRILHKLEGYPTVYKIVPHEKLVGDRQEPVKELIVSVDRLKPYKSKLEDATEEAPLEDQMQDDPFAEGPFLEPTTEQEQEAQWFQENDLRDTPQRGEGEKKKEPTSESDSDSDSDPDSDGEPMHDNDSRPGSPFATIALPDVKPDSNTPPSSSSASTVSSDPPTPFRRGIKRAAESMANLAQAKRDAARLAARIGGQRRPQPQPQPQRGYLRPRRHRRPPGWLKDTVDPASLNLTTSSSDENTTDKDPNWEPKRHR